MSIEPAPLAPTPPVIARRRWLAIAAVRIAGVSGAVLGLVLAARAPTIGPKLLGVAIVLSALVVIAVVPASLAHRWRSGRP